jgi:opacity protein-like surface antigen
MIKPQKRSLRQAIVGGIAAVVSAVLPGCFTGGSVGAYVGSHNPSSQRNAGTIIFDNSTETGVTARAETKSKVELKVAYSGHETNWTDGATNEDLEVKDLSVSASYPLWSNGTVSVNAGAGVVSRSETQTESIVGLPGSYVEDRTSTGWKAGVEARWQPHKNVSVEAGVEYHQFGEGSYEEAGTTASIGASYTF